MQELLSFAGIIRDFWVLTFRGILKAYDVRFM